MIMLILSLLRKTTLFLVFIMLTCNVYVLAQMDVEPGTTAPFEPEQLIQNVFLGNGIEVTNVEFRGVADAVGYFSGGQDIIGVDQGLIMSTGLVFQTDQAISNGSSPNGSIATDATLASYTADTLKDVAVFEITFIPEADTLQFEYVFASEEYPEFGCDCFNDIFGFFIQGPNYPDFTNIGLLPGTNEAVSVNTVHPLDPDGDRNACATQSVTCEPVNEHLYVDNANNPNFFYDGFTTVFSAKAVVVPCNIYTIKLAIADVRDDQFDSAVFFKGRSFGSNGLDIETATVSFDGTVVEGCAEGRINFSIPAPQETDLELNYTIGGSALNGVDYEFLPSTITIPAGDTVASLVINALEDNQMELQETITVTIGEDACNTKTIRAFIRDSALPAPDLDDDTNICQNETLQLDGNLNIPQDQELVFATPNSQTLVINEVPENRTSTNNATVSELTVSGVFPEELNEDMLQRICIDITHTRTEEVDVYLETPDGILLELTTDNGGSGDNYTNTCFTPRAVQSIKNITEADAPFSGDYSPESSWDYLWGSAVNGVWKLYLKDDVSGISGALNGWSITINPVYTINYEWTPADGLSCTDCPNPTAAPDTTTTYHLQITDAYGCLITDSIKINIAPELEAPVVDCIEATDTSLTFEWAAIASASGYEVNVDGQGWQPANQPGGLAHQITGLAEEQIVNIEVRGMASGANCGVAVGNSSCMTTQSQCTIPAITSITPQAVSCNGQNDGSIQVTANIADALFVIGTDTNTTGQFASLVADEYRIQVLSADKECAIEQLVEITEPELFVVLPNQFLPPSCYGFSDGRLSVEPTGGTAPYSYNWTHESNPPDTAILANIAAGDYQLVATDANGCQTTPLYIPVPQPDSIEIDLKITDPACFKNQNGQAEVEINNASGFVNVVWSTLDFGNTVSNLSGGNYQVSITDDNGCGDTLDFTIKTPVPIDLTGSTTDASCSGSFDGVATATANGGAGNFSFIWNDAQQQTTPVANSLDVGQYQVVATDELGCSDTLFLEVNSPNAIQVDSTTTHLVCAGQPEGAISVNVSGGNPDYTYNWADAGMTTTPDRTGLAAGNYQLTIMDASQCEVTLNFRVNEPKAIAIQVDEIPAQCGASNGQLVATATGGSGNLSFLWNDADAQTSATATALRAGVYRVEVTDENGCSQSEEVTLTETGGLNLTLESQPVYCSGEATGRATVRVTGGQGQYRYLWDDPQAQQTPIAFSLTPGDYMVLVLDENGCESTGTVTIADESRTPVSIDFATTEVGCTGILGSVSASVSGGFSPYTFQWEGINNQTDMLENVEAGTYILEVTDDRGCISTDTAIVQQAEMLFAEIVSEGVSCPGDKDGFIEFIPIGGKAPYQYSIDGRRFSRDSLFQNLRPGVYQPVITDDNECVLELEGVLVPEAEALTVSLPVLETRLEEPILLIPQVNRNDTNLIFNWMAADTSDLSCTNCQNPWLNPTITQRYTLEVEDSRGCTASTQFQVFARKEQQIYVPTGFTPNGDGYNDRLTVYGKEGTRVISFKVFDRWGEMVYAQYDFTVNDEMAGWDGVFRGQMFNTGVFTWMAEVQFGDENIIVQNGHTTLIR